MIHPHLIPAEVVPAVPALGGVAFGVATLATLLAFIACWGLRHAWAATIGYGLRWIAAEIRDVSIPTGFFGSIHPFGRVADAFEALDYLVSHALAVAALNAQHAFVYCAHHAAHIFVWTGEEIARISRDTFFFGWNLYNHTLPRLEGQVLHYAARGVEIAIGDVRRWVWHRDRATQRANEAAQVKTLAHVHGLEGTLGHVVPRVNGLERDFTGLKARLRSIEKRLTPAAIVALIGATIFDQFGMEWLRCKSNPFHNNKNACGLWTVLGRVLELAGLLTIAFDFKAFVSAAQHVANGIGEGVAKIEGRFELALPPLPPPMD